MEELITDHQKTLEEERQEALMPLAEFICQKMLPALVKNMEVLNEHEQYND